MKPEIVVLDAPSNLGLRPPRPDHLPGVWKLPTALRANGLLERLNAVDGGTVSAPAYSAEPHPETGFRNGSLVAAYAQTLAERVKKIVQADHFPLVLGGDCSILLGNLLALRALDRYGLCFIDGHQDFAYSSSLTQLNLRTAAGVDLGLATGRGPDALTNIDGFKPYVDEAHVVALGFYDDPADAHDDLLKEIYNTQIKTIDIEEIHRIGAQAAALIARERLEQSGLAGFWIHLDVDVLDQSIMPAVDSPNPNGLTFEELVTILRVVLGSQMAIGMEITIFDPERDPDGSYAAALVDAIERSFQ